MDSTAFMPHGYCFLWNPALLALQVGSDALIAIAYFSIPLVLYYFARKRTDLPFSRIFSLFGTFIVACGITHIMSIVTIWQPLYWLDGFFKAVTAVASVGTALVLLPIVPKALALRSPAELERVNAELQELLTRQSELTAAYEREHHVAKTLQNALLPQSLPAIAGLDIRTAYRPAGHGLEIGGDWFDAFAISEHQIGISCGDVAGHGLLAASLMGSVRQMLRVAAREDDDPTVVLGRINRMVCSEEASLCVTAFYGVLDLTGGVLRYGTAGHPPPIVGSADEPVRFLAGEGLMLGVDSGESYRQYRTTLAASDLLVVYTDGCVEQTRDIERGMAGLAAAVAAEAAADTPDAAASIHESIFGETAPRDDVAILTIRVRALGAQPADRLRRVWQIDATDGERGRRLRTAVVRYLGEYADAASDFAGAELVVGELLGNVARHTPGAARLEVEWRNGAASLTVADVGPPFQARERLPTDEYQEHGRGLALISMFARDVVFERTDSGNAVRLTLPVTLA